MKIALIGGSGFIGTQLAKQLLNQGHEIRILDLTPSATYPEHFHRADITDRQSLIDGLHDIDAIYHLAAAHRDDISPKSIYYDVNVTGTQNVVDAADHHGIKHIIFTSSVAVYALNAQDSKESDTPAPFNDYGASKLQAEGVLTKWYESHHSTDHHATDQYATLTMIRLVATFGPGNKGNVFTLINQIKGGKFLMIGRGKNQKTIAYVENVAQFMAHLLSCPHLAKDETKLSNSNRLAIFNYADKPDLTMIDMVKTIRKYFGMSPNFVKVPYAIGLMGGYCFDLLSALTGKKFPISAIRVQKFCANTIVNSDKMRKDTGFTPAYSLEEGLKAMIEADFTQKP